MYIDRLLSHFPEIVCERPFSFARHTTIGCGGRADIALYPGSLACAATLNGYLMREKIPFCILGAGANSLADDGDFCGAVVRFTLLRDISLSGETVFAGAGVTGGALCRTARRNGIGGFEPFTGIPLTVGGGIVMNAGVAGGHFSDVVSSVLFLEGGKLRRMEGRACGFSEKRSVFQEGLPVVGACLKGEKRSEGEISARTEYYRARRSHLPKGRSMGCTFVNPEGDSAGRLIDACGFKGFSVGGAHISREHANFIINEGAGTAEIKQLIETVRAGVFEQTGVLLREEIRYLP